MIRCQCGSCDKVDQYSNDYYNERCLHCKSRSLWRVSIKQEQIDDLVKEARIRIASGLVDRSDPLQLFGHLIEDVDQETVERALTALNEG